MSITCKKCGAVNPDDSAVICPNCGVVYAKSGSSGVSGAAYGSDRVALSKMPQARDREAPFSLVNLLLSVFGAALLALGTFMPIFSFGLMKISYFKDGKGDGLYVLIAAGIILIGALLRSRRVVGYLSFASLALITVDLFFATQKISEAQSKIAHDVEGNPFGGLAIAIGNSMSLDWGWGVMYLGGAIALLGAMLSEQWFKKHYGG